VSRTVPVRESRTHLADLLDEVAERREHVIVSRRGRPAAVMVPVDGNEALDEMAEILSDEPTLASPRVGRGQVSARSAVGGVEPVGPVARVGVSVGPPVQALGEAWCEGFARPPVFAHE
jgi:antitoxin YefM